MWLKRTARRISIASVPFAVALLALSLRGAPSAEENASPPASPPAAQQKPATLATLVQALRSTRYQEREDATFALLRLPPQSRSDIEDALARETDPEAVARLTRVAVHLLLKAQTDLNGAKPLMGITLGVEPRPQTSDKLEDLHSAVVVMGVQPGFPAAEVLESGDRILAVDNRPFPDVREFTFDDFRAMVNARRPGSTLNLTILRDGRKFKAAVQLAGLQQDDPQYIAQFVANRQDLVARYLENLKTGLVAHSLIVNDDTPDDPATGGVIIPTDP